MTWQESWPDFAAPFSAATGRLPEAPTVDTEELHTRQRRLPAAPPRLFCATRYALDAVPLPLLTDALAVGEWARQAALSQYGSLTGGCQSPVLSGRAGNEPLVGHHHAYYLPADEDGDGLIEHLTVYASGGFNTFDLEALARLRKLWAGTERPEIHLDLLGLYTGGGIQDAHPWCRPARVWESVTPYVLTRHPKVYRTGRPKTNDRGEQVDGPEDQARREWTAHQAQDPGLAELLAVEQVPDYELPAAGRRMGWLEYRRWRSRGGGASTGFACGLRLTFAAPVPGPLPLGYGCHFGLGQFRPCQL